MSVLFGILAVVGTAMFAGVMLAIGVILGRFWKSLPPAEFIDWFGHHGHLIMRAIPLVVVPALVGLVGVLWYDWKEPATRGLWLAASACIAGVIGITMAYFAPSNAAFAAKAVALDQVPAKLDRWLLLHSLRIALAVAAAVLGILAIKL